ncbi:insulin-induced gene 1 protein-like isoform X2 [Sciurus carolinensis]|uniref:insulin-induced gene 1 protein-like isoform X2 n=1 Tax=Sciurus carolinensis TaxID=30640 RepID=UPI001FB20FE6|nr:insulin-induced gene 1 protein-like isoform X2 [Sciurus carolinensis]
MPRLHDHFWSCPCAGAARYPSPPRARAAKPAAEPGDMSAAAAQAAGADPSPRGPRAGASGRASSWHHYLVQRSLVLFSVGVVLALVLNLLQIQRNVTLFPDEVIATIFSSAWWVPPCCGTAAGTHPQISSIFVRGSHVYFSQESSPWET